MSLPLRRIAQDISSLQERVYDIDSFPHVLTDSESKARYLGVVGPTTSTDLNNAPTPRLQREPLRPSHQETTNWATDVEILLLLLAWITDEEQRVVAAAP